MTDDSTKTVRWELVFHEGASHAWSWRRIGENRAIEETSEPHPYFGKALADAILNGFRPKKQHWVLKSEKWTTYFPPGGSPISTGPDGQVVQRRALRPWEAQKQSGDQAPPTLPKTARW